MAQTYYCMACGSENPIKDTKCSCGASINDIELSKPTISRATQQSSVLSVPLGERLDFSAFASLAADLEKEVGGLGDERDLGKWGAKSIDGRDLFNK